MFKLIVLIDAIEEEIEGEFSTKIEAEHYAESVGFEAYKVVPV